MVVIVTRQCKLTWEGCCRASRLLHFVGLVPLGVKSEGAATEDAMAVDSSEQGEPASPVRAVVSSHQGYVCVFVCVRVLVCVRFVKCYKHLIIFHVCVCPKQHWRVCSQYEFR